MPFSVFDNDSSWAWPDDEEIESATFVIRGNGGGGGFNGGGGGGGGACVVHTVTRGAESVISFEGLGTTPAGTDGTDIEVTQDAVLVAKAAGGKQGGDNNGTGGLGGKAADCIGFSAIDGGDGGDGSEVSGGGGGAGGCEGGPGGDGDDAYNGVGLFGFGGVADEDCRQADGGNGGYADTAPTNGLRFGGGGGGGRTDEHGGTGGKGRVLVYWGDQFTGTKASSGCCCCTPEETGMPSNVTFSITSTGSDPLPSDIEFPNACFVSVSQWLRFASANPMLALVSDIVLELDEEISSGCCFTYRTVGDYEPTCDTDPATPNPVKFGKSPFRPFSWGESTQKAVYDDNVSDPEVDCGEEDCCESPPAESCYSWCTPAIVTASGTLYVPLDIFGSVLMTICIDGTSVSILINILFVAPASTYGGVSTLSMGFEEDTECPVPIPLVTGTYDEGCDYSFQVLNLSATQDVSGSTGATLWDKIKNSTWEFEYEFTQGWMGGGCTDFETEVHCTCNLDCSCICSVDCEAPVNFPLVGVDAQAIYSAGEITISLA